MAAKGPGRPARVIECLPLNHASRKSSRCSYCGCMCLCLCDHVKICVHALFNISPAPESRTLIGPFFASYVLWSPPSRRAVKLTLEKVAGAVDIVFLDSILRIKVIKSLKIIDGKSCFWNVELSFFAFQGSGSFGDIYLGTNIQSGDEVLFKF